MVYNVVRKDRAHPVYDTPNRMPVNLTNTGRFVSTCIHIHLPEVVGCGDNEDRHTHWAMATASVGPK